jgi:hypothetical protein
MSEMANWSIKKKKQFLRDIVKRWNKAPVKVIAKTWQVEASTIHAYLRRKGIKLPRINSSSKYLTTDFLGELNNLLTESAKEKPEAE